MAVHEGNANRRLASEVKMIFILPSTEVPEKYKDAFLELKNLIKDALQNTTVPGLTPMKLGKIKNKTAAEYIRLLYTIMEDMTDYPSPAT